jgi:citrate synthase
MAPARTEVGKRNLLSNKKSGRRLMGFGHIQHAMIRAQRSSKGNATNCLKRLRLPIRCWLSPCGSRQAALSDPYFIERKVYPNVDFYSGIMMRAIGIPSEMFTALLAMGRMPGWIAN